MAIETLQAGEITGRYRRQTRSQPVNQFQWASKAMSSDPKIREIRASACTIPTDLPEADGTLEWHETTIVLVEASAGDETGLGYSYTHAAAVEVIEKTLAPLVKDQPAEEIPAIWERMLRRVRNLGRQGIVASAISAVDNALWDLKAKLWKAPLAHVLGAARTSVPIYGSGGFTSYSIKQLQHQLGDWVQQGIPRVKMKIGTHPEQDRERVKAARGAIGLDAELFVDANGAYSQKQALEFANDLVEDGVSWFEEPVSSDDLEGLRFIRERTPASIEIAAGEYGYDPWYFETMLHSGAVDVLQADATRCLGITGFMKVGAMCAAQHIPFSAHTAPAIHLHACCALNNVRHIEYFHDHVRIENMLFDGVAQPRNGLLTPDLSRFGMGIELKRSAAKRFAA